MSHLFKVGDRVRLVRASQPSNNGIQGVIVEFRFSPEGTVTFSGQRLHIDSNCTVLYDGDPRPCFEHTDRIEPLNPPKQQEKITWDEACFDRDGKFRIGVAA